MSKELRREAGRNFGAMLGSFFGQMAAKRSRDQLGQDADSLREIADKSLASDNPMTADDYASRLTGLYRHHGVNLDEGFQADVGAYASKVGRRKSAAFAENLYPDKPLLSGTPQEWPISMDDVRATEDFNREQARQRKLMSRFTPEQQLNYFTGQAGAANKNSLTWAKYYSDLANEEARQDLEKQKLENLADYRTKTLDINQEKVKNLADYQTRIIKEQEKKRVSDIAQKIAGRLSAEKIAGLRAEATTTAAKTRAASGRKPSTAEINLGLILDAISKGKMQEMPMEDILIQAGVMKGKTPPELREALGNLVFLDEFNDADLNGKIETIKGIVDSFNPQKESAPVDAMQYLNMNPDATPGY